MHLLALAALALQPTLPGSARTPAYAPDGRVAIAVDGALWVSAPPATAGLTTPIRWIRVTAGPAWDREPAWTADGAALVFASDRGGGSHLWRVRVAADGPAGE